MSGIVQRVEKEGRIMGHWTSGKDVKPSSDADQLYVEVIFGSERI
jgi:hypothetical protein